MFWFKQKFIKVSQREIKQLYRRFKRLDKDGSGTISRDEFLSIPELAMNPIASRMIAVFEGSNARDQVNFKQFITTLSIFSEKESVENKIKCNNSVFNLEKLIKQKIKSFISTL